MRHAPDHLKAHEDRQHKHDEMLHEAGRGDKTDSQQQTTANCQQTHLIARLEFEGCNFCFLFLFRRQLFRLGLCLPPCA